MRPICPMWELSWLLDITASSTCSLPQHRPCLWGGPTWGARKGSVQQLLCWSSRRVWPCCRHYGGGTEQGRQTTWKLAVQVPAQGACRTRLRLGKGRSGSEFQ